MMQSNVAQLRNYNFGVLSNARALFGANIRQMGGLQQKLQQLTARSKCTLYHKRG